MPILKLIPDDTNIGFVRIRHICFAVTALLTVLALGAIGLKGLNFGVDFVGGLMIEAKFEQAADIEQVRSTIDGLNVGTVSLQQFGAEDTVSIRLPLPGDGNEASANQVVQQVLGALRQTNPGVTFTRYDTVSGKVSDELIWNGSIAVILSVLGIALFSWFRYEWQFGVSTFVAVVHDAIMTLGLFAVTQMEFDLSIVAALLTVIGYSINDKIVIDDRIRENMRKYRKMDMGPLIDLSVNEVLPRTIMTTVTLLVALIALLVFGGHVLRGFSAAMMLGVVVGTYSSIYVSASILITLGLRPNPEGAPVASAERTGPRNEGKLAKKSDSDGAQV